MDLHRAAAVAEAPRLRGRVLQLRCGGAAPAGGVELGRRDARDDRAPRGDPLAAGDDACRAAVGDLHALDVHAGAHRPAVVGDEALERRDEVRRAALDDGHAAEVQAAGERDELQRAAGRGGLQAGVQHPRRVEQAGLGARSNVPRSQSRALCTAKRRARQPVARAPARPATGGRRRARAAPSRAASPTSLRHRAEPVELGEERRAVLRAEALHGVRRVAQGDQRVAVTVRDARRHVRVQVAQAARLELRAELRVGRRPHEQRVPRRERCRAGIPAA